MIETASVTARKSSVILGAIIRDGDRKRHF